MAGSSQHGGVLALMGDDHTAESSTMAHQSEFHFVDVMIPILNPAGVQEIIDYGLYGYAMGRFCGTWAAFKCVRGEDQVTTASVDGQHRPSRKSSFRTSFQIPPGGLKSAPRTPCSTRRRGCTTTTRRGARLRAHQTRFNHNVLSGGRNPKVGVVTVGKS